MTRFWSERRKEKPDLGVGFGREGERFVEEDLLDALIHFDEAFLRPLDALLDQTRLLAEPFLPYPCVIPDLSGGDASVLLDGVGLAARLGVDLLDLLVGREHLLAPVRLCLGLRLPENVLCLLARERDDVLSGLLRRGEDCSDARSDPRIVLRAGGFVGLGFGSLCIGCRRLELLLLLRALFHGRLGRRFSCVHHVREYRLLRTPDFRPNCSGSPAARARGGRARRSALPRDALPSARPGVSPLPSSGQNQVMATYKERDREIPAEERDGEEESGRSAPIDEDVEGELNAALPEPPNGEQEPAQDSS